MERLRARIRREGPVPFSVFMDEALYGPEGFYVRGGGAGRGRDFLTSPEVGPLFGAVIARALDAWWADLGEPDPFVVVECGAGPGTLCRDVLRADLRCAGALRYVLVETSEPMRDAQRRRGLPMVEPFEIFGHVGLDDDGDARVEHGQGPLVCALDAMPATDVHVVFANELLDNFPFDVAQATADGWSEVRVAAGDADTFVPTLVPLDPKRDATLRTLVPAPSLGATVPLQHRAQAWINEAVAAVAATGGRVVVIDYAASAAELALRDGQWLRTYRLHERGVDPFTGEGTCDITADLAIDLVTSGHRPGHVRTQAEFLVAHGMGDLVLAARKVWADRAALGDLVALMARSRIGEGQALSDPAGLGAFKVVEW
jgi:SAM-dependent MidA family methyltransferase